MYKMFEYIFQKCWFQNKSSQDLPFPLHTYQVRGDQSSRGGPGAGAAAGWRGYIYLRTIENI